jgi:hypothetical protein
MELEKLVKRLERLTGGERVPENTIKNWAHTERIIPTPIGGGKGGRVSGGEARKGDWPPEALEQSAAVWWVRKKYSTMYGKKKKKLSKDQINVIKRAASVLDKSPFAVYHLSPITGPLSRQEIAPEAITMTFIREDFDGINLFPGKKPQERLDCLNTLVVGWIAAREKVRAWVYKGMSLVSIMKVYPSLEPGEVFSQIDPWRVVDATETETGSPIDPPPWRLDRPARVALLWRSRPSKSKHSTDWKFSKWNIPPLQTRLNDSDRDEIVVYENWVDTREFFKIDVDREGYARAEIEKKERELEEVEREMCRLGMEPRWMSYNRLADIEIGKIPFDSLTEREQQYFKLAGKWFDLTKSLVWGKSDFGVEEDEKLSNPK